MRGRHRRRLGGPLLAGWALAWGFTASPALARPDALLSEIQTHFHATRKWFGMVSDLALDRAADGSLTPRFETLHSKFVLRKDAAGQTLRARLPPTANGAHLVEFDGIPGFTVRTEEIGIKPVPAEIRQGVVVYRGSVAGGDLLYKLTPTHVDEYIYLPKPPAHLRRELEFDTGGAVWALREADGMIEVLGKDGIARLRLSAPLARASDGERRRGTVHIHGRTIVLDIELSGLTAPILVDPDWSTTGTMTVAHWGDAAWRRPDGRVMAVGGCALSNCPVSFTQTACGQVLAITEAWDPASGTWTSAAPMATARTTFAGVALPSGDMIVAGGCTSTNCAQKNDAGSCLATLCTQTTALSERYSIASASWVPSGALATPRAYPMGAPVGSGDAIVAGGCDVGSCTAETERWSAGTNTWSVVAPLPEPRGYASSTPLADGRVLVAGGCADTACATLLDDAVVYDPVADAWSSAGTMSSPRAGHSATLLGDGTVLVAGGCTDATCSTTLSSAEIWTSSGAGGGFALAPAMAGARHHHTATLMNNGEVLMAGGADSTGSTVPTSEVYLPIARQWIGTSAMLMSRAYHIGASLTDGRVLVGGGCNPQTCIPFAEVFSPSTLPMDSDAGVDASVLVDSGVDAAAIDAGTAPLSTSPHPALYRTGVTTCANDTTQDLACPVTGWELQDGVFQPDLQAFSTSASDEVTDRTTGLIWQRGDDGQMYDYPTAVKHCAAFQSAEAPTGWRLPSVIELMTLVDNGVDLPSMDPSFLGAQANNYWTSTPTAASKLLAWTVKFDFGEIIPLLLDTPLPVRCVRGESGILNVGRVGLRKAGPLQALPDTVQDTTTMLEWQRQDDGTKRTWKDSLDYCSRLSLGGLSGWHLPNISELLSIVQYDGLYDGVAIDPAFESPKGDLYWTATQNEGLPTLSWSITFNLGVVDGVTVTGFGYARCVRHMAPPNPPDAGVDAGHVDSGRMDSGRADAGRTDAGRVPVADAAIADAVAGAPSAAGGGCSCEIARGTDGRAAPLLGASVVALLAVRRRRRARGILAAAGFGLSTAALGGCSGEAGPGGKADATRGADATHADARTDARMDARGPDARVKSRADAGRVDASAGDGAIGTTDGASGDAASCGDGCAGDLTCCGGTCVSTTTDTSHCGTCGTACGAGTSCCGGACTNLGLDPKNCGACAVRCPMGDTCSVSGCSDWATWPIPNPVSATLPNPASYTSMTGYVIDNVTNLWWQQPIDGSNNLSMDCSGGCTQAQAVSYCANLTLALHNDWRLPTRIELASIVDYTVQNPAINTTAFPGTPPEGFWTSSPYVSGSAVGWYVIFSDGSVSAASNIFGSRVRCVR